MLAFGTLGRYFSGRFARTILLVFATVFVLVYTLDFVELMRRSGDAPGATPQTMARLALYRTPAVAEQVLPFAILFGSMAALLQLSRKLELVVARAAGISAWQFLQPGLLVGLAIGVLSVTVYNPLSAVLKRDASAMEARIFPRGENARETWIRQRSSEGHAILRANAISRDNTTLLRVTAFTFTPGGSFVERIDAAQAVLQPGAWELKDARVVSLTNEPRSVPTFRLASNLDPSQVRQSFVSPDAVPFWDLSETIQRTERAGLDASRYRLRYDVLLARPLLFVAMVFVAASVSLRFFRFGGIARMVLGGVAAGFVLYVATELMEDLGASGLISPMVAAWFPAVVGSLLGTLALLYQEDG